MNKIPGDCTTAMDSPRTPLDKEFDTICKCIEELESQITMIESKLAFILNPEEPIPERPKESQLVRNTESNVRTLMRSFQAKISDQTSRLQHITRRIDL